MYTKSEIGRVNVLLKGGKDFFLFNSVQFYKIASQRQCQTGSVCTCQWRISVKSQRVTMSECSHHGH